MKSSSIPPRWPSGIVPWLALVGMGLGLSVSHIPSCRVGPLAWIYTVGVTLFRSEAMFRGVMDLAAAVHVVEAGVIAFMCRARGCTPVHTLGWMLITLLIGYGGMHSLKVQTRRRDQATAKLRASKAS